MRRPAHDCQDVANGSRPRLRHRGSAVSCPRRTTTSTSRRSRDPPRGRSTSALPDVSFIHADRPRRVQPRSPRHGNRDPAARRPPPPPRRALSSTSDVAPARSPHLALRAPQAAGARRRRELAGAIALCATNAIRLGLTNVTVAHPDEVPATRVFDLIWSNPPIRIGKPALHALLDDVARATGTGRVGRPGRPTPPRRRLAAAVAAVERPCDAPPRGPLGYRLIASTRNVVRGLLRRSWRNITR